MIKKILIVTTILLLSSCGYHLRSGNKLAETYPVIYLSVKNDSLLKYSLANALIASGVKLVKSENSDSSNFTITKDSLRKVIQSIGTRNQVQEYRLEYDVEFVIEDGQTKSIHLEKDYSFDIQQIGGGQQEEQTLRKQLADDMAWAIIRQINVTLK